MRHRKVPPGTKVVPADNPAYKAADLSPTAWAQAQERQRAAYLKTTFVERVAQVLTPAEMQLYLRCSAKGYTPTAAEAARMGVITQKLDGDALLAGLKAELKKLPEGGA